MQHNDSFLPRQFVYNLFERIDLKPKSKDEAAWSVLVDTCIDKVLTENMWERSWTNWGV